MADNLTQAELIIKRVEAGEEITVDERRKALAWKMATEPDLTLLSLAKFFGISETMVRKDRDIIRKQIAEEVSKDDVGLVIGDIIRHFDRLIAEVEESAKKATKGSNTYLQHKKLSADLLRHKTEILQSLNYYPKNLGNLTKSEYKFVAIVNPKNGNAEAIPLAAGEIATKKQLPLPTDTPEDAALRKQFEDEFAENPAPVIIPPNGAES